MTEQELAEITERASKATPGPWWHKDGWEGAMPGDEWYVYQEQPLGEIICCPCRSNPSEANAEFIAHAREDIPALLAEVRRLRELEARAMDHLLTSPSRHGQEGKE